MNIFVLSRKPQLCAAYHCDKHVVKMIIEYTQMLSTCTYYCTGASPLKPTHKNHPCTLWVMKSIHNYRRLSELASYLCVEYTKRYGKIHALERVIKDLTKAPAGLPRTKNITPFVTVMPEQYVHKNPLRAYRDYYLYDKVRFARWKYTKTPYRFSFS